MKRHLPAVLCLGALLAACAQPAPPPPRAAVPAPIVVSDTLEAVYSVRSVNRRTRQIQLNTPEDKVITIKAGPEVRNFNQIRVGDRVRVRFAEGVAFSVAPPGSPAPSPEAIVAAGRSPEGRRPAGAVGTLITETVKIVSVDPATGKTTFIRPDGTTRVVTPRSAEGIAFAKALKPGDMVNITFGEGAAIEVQPANA